MFFASQAWLDGSPVYVKNNKVKPMTVEMEQDTCVLRLEWQDYVFHGRDQGYWLIGLEPIKVPDGYARWRNLVAVR
jgi:hypothetical protein